MGVQQTRMAAKLTSLCLVFLIGVSTGVYMHPSVYRFKVTINHEGQGHPPLKIFKLGQCGEGVPASDIFVLHADSLPNESTALFPTPKEHRQK